MAPTQASRRAVFRTIAQTTYSEWPAYDSTPLYDRSSLDGLEADIQTVTVAWFDHDAHVSVEEFRSAVPLLRVCVSTVLDLLVQVELTGEYEHSPIVTADNTLTLLKKETGIG